MAGGAGRCTSQQRPGYTTYPGTGCPNDDQCTGTYSSTGTHDWEYGQRVIVPEKPIRNINVYLLFRGAHTGRVWFDDVRVVEIQKPDPKGHWFYEDFENVDEGWGPFVYGYQGSTRTHLSEAHAPYTDDTIEGQFSRPLNPLWSFYMTAGVLRKMIHRTSFAAAKQDTKYAITGILWEVEDKRVRLVATDTRRLAMCVGPATATAPKPNTIPISAIAYLITTWNSNTKNCWRTSNN